MPVSLQDLSGYITPRQPAQGLDLSGAIGSILKAIAEKKDRELAEKQLQASQDANRANVEQAMRAAQMRASSAADKQALEKDKYNLEKQKQQTNVLTGIEGMIAQNPTMAKATLSANNMLGNRAEQGFSDPATMSVLDQAGFPGSGAYDIIAGDRTFGINPEQIKATAEQQTQELFAKNTETPASEADKMLAETVAGMSPEAVRVMEGNKEKAAAWLSKLYNDRKRQLQIDMKKRGMGTGKGETKSGYSGDPRIYLAAVKDAENTLKGSRFYEGDAALAKMSQAYKGIKSGNGTEVWTGIRALLGMQGEGSRPSDFDVKRARGLQSTWTKIKSWAAENIEGDISQAEIEQISTALLHGMQIRHEEQKAAYGSLRSRLTDSRFREQQDATTDVLNSAFSKPHYSWFKRVEPENAALGYAAPTNEGRESESNDAAAELDGLLREEEGD